MTVLSRVQWSIEQRGVVGTMKAAARGLKRKIASPGGNEVTPHPFDVEHGVDTSGFIAGHRLIVGHQNDRYMGSYGAIPPSSLRGALTRWQASGPAHPIEDYTFMDFGCGKGRAMLLASEVAFRAVVGVELNPRLAEVANANARIWKDQGKGRTAISVLCGDALEVEPPDGPVLVYLYNPFGESVVSRLAERLKRRYVKEPDNLEVIYQKAEHSAIFEDAFKLVWSGAIPLSAEDTAVELIADPKDMSRGYRPKW